MDDQITERESLTYKAMELSSYNVASITPNLTQFRYCQRWSKFSFRKIHCLEKIPGFYFLLRHTHVFHFATLLAGRPRLLALCLLTCWWLKHLSFALDPYNCLAVIIGFNVVLKVGDIQKSQAIRQAEFSRAFSKAARKTAPLPKLLQAQNKFRQLHRLPTPFLGTQSDVVNFPLSNFLRYIPRHIPLVDPWS